MQRIRFETAKLLKEKTSDFKDYEGDFYEDEHEEFPAPYQEEVIEWLWEKHKIYIEMYLKQYGLASLCYSIKTSIKYILEGIFVKEELKDNFETRNDAIEQGIIRALELIK